MKILQWAIDRLIPYARNARKIPQEAIDKVAASIKEFGWQQPIVVDTERVVVAGHVRLLAAKQLGLEKVPVHVAADLTPGQIKAFRLMDNRSHQESGWDMELLAPEMAELQALNVDASLTGFDADEISKFLDSTGSEGDPPDSFREYDETIPTEHQCPKCGYTWSGAAGPKPEGPSEDLAA
jgi:ParB-like chromosome segregation protein Spo0J